MGTGDCFPGYVSDFVRELEDYLLKNEAFFEVKKKEKFHLAVWIARAYFRIVFSSLSDFPIPSEEVCSFFGFSFLGKLEKARRNTS